MTMINGDVKHYISLNYVLKPKAPGNFSIAPATAKADGKELKTNPVSVQVSNTLASNATGGNNFNSPFSGLDPFADAAPQASFRISCCFRMQWPLTSERTLPDVSSCPRSAVDR